MKDYYPLEKFNDAIKSMLMSQESIQKRLANAYANELHLVNSDKLPETIKQQFKQLQKKLISTDNINKMDTITAIESINELFDVYKDIITDYYQQ